MECGWKPRKVGFDPEKDLWCFYDEDDFADEGGFTEGFGDGGAGDQATDAASEAATGESNDNDGFFSGTFDDPGEPGFTGPSYEGQYGFDSEGDYYGSDFTDYSDFYEFSKFENALDKIGAIQNTGFNFNKDYAVMDRYGDVRGFDPRGGRYDAGDAAFFSRAIGEYGVAGDIYGSVDRSTGFGATVRRGFEGLANGIAERFGTSMTRDYTVIPGQGYVGQVFEDYGFTDALGNLIGTLTPGGARVDRYMSRELTSTGKGAMAFGEGKAFFGAIDTQYAMTPEEEQAMFAAQREADEAERAQGGGGASDVASAVTGTVTRPGSAILGSLLGDTTNPAYNIVAPYSSDAFSYFTGGIRDYLGFAEGGEVPGAQMGGEQEAITGPVGFVGGPPEQMTDAETVADDVPVEVQEGAYVLNAAAVEYMGSADVKNMILDAMQELKAQGVDKVQDVDKIELDTQVSLLVSKGEVLIPPQVAEVIGYDRLEKINKRGLRETQKRVDENGQSPEAEALDQPPENPAEGMAAPMAVGGEVKDNFKLPPEYLSQPLDERVKQMDESLDRKFALFDEALQNLGKLYNREILKTPEELNEYYNKAREEYQKRVRREQAYDPEAFDVIKDKQEQKYVGLLNEYAFSDKALPGDEEVADKATMISTIPFGSDDNKILPSMNPNKITYGFTYPTVGPSEAFIAGGADTGELGLSLEDIGMHEAFHDLTGRGSFVDRTGLRFSSELTTASIDYIRAIAQDDVEKAEKLGERIKNLTNSRMSRYRALQLGIDVISQMYESGAYDKDRALSERAKKVLENAEKLDKEFKELQEPPPSGVDAYSGATVSTNPSVLFDDPIFMELYVRRLGGTDDVKDLLSILPFSKRVESEDRNYNKYVLDSEAIQGKENGGKVESFDYPEEMFSGASLVKQGEPQQVTVQETPDQSFISAQGKGVEGTSSSEAQIQAEAGRKNPRTGEGFAVRPRVNYNEQKRSQEFPDGVVVDEQGKNIGFALEGQMFLSNDKSLRAGIEQQKSKFDVDVNLPAEYGGETIEFGGGSKMKRYNMGATFGPVDVDLSKTQVPEGEDVLGGSVRYRFSEDGDVTLEATDGGRSGRIGLNYRF